MIDFSGGLNTDQHEILLGDNEATDILNFKLDKAGSLVTRDGLSLINEDMEDLPNSVLQLGAWHNPANLPQSHIMAKLDNGSVIWHNPTIPAMGVAATGFSTTARGTFASAQNYTLYADGSRVPIVYNGTSAIPMGVAAPAAAPTVTAGGSGHFDGDWSFVVSWVVGAFGAESQRSPSTTEAFSSEVPTVTRPGSPPAEVDGWNVYARNDADPNRLFYLMTPTPIPIATTTFTADDLPTRELLYPQIAQSTPTVAPNLEKVAFFNGCYFGSIGDELYWSTPFGPGTWPGENYTRLPFEGNDRVMGMAALQDSLVIFGRRNILVVSGFFPAFTITRVDAAIGLAGDDAVAEIEGQVVFLSDEGMRIYPGFGVIGEGIQRTLALKSINAKRDAILRHSPRENALWLTIDGITYVLFLKFGSISKYDFNPTAVLAGGITGVEANALTDSAGTTIFRHEGEEDNGSPIRVKWDSKIFQMDNPEATKYIRRIGMFATRGSEAQVKIVLKDTQGSSYEVTPTAQAEHSSYWDDFLWDDGSRWSTEGVTYFIAALPAQTLIGMTLQITIDGLTSSKTEFVPPFTLLYRESLRFLGR